MKDKDMAKKMLILGYILSITLIIFLIFEGVKDVQSELGGEEIQCNSAGFCSDSLKRIECRAIEDGYCPYDFGDWIDLDGGKTCKRYVHNAGTESEFGVTEPDYCEICDPDCAVKHGSKCFAPESVSLKDVQVRTGR